jgi:hypothetical protein
MKSIMMIMAVVLATGSVASGYTYTIGPGECMTPGTLNNHESMLVQGGWGDRLNLFDYSSARIESTTALSHPWSSGHGISSLVVCDYSTLTITGGEISQLDVIANSKTTISGGTIEYLCGLLSGSIPAVPADKYIQFICKSYAYNTGARRLTGAWADDSLFSIQLMDTSPWPSGFTYDSINFTIVPEPLSLGLLALGGLLVRKHRRAG